MLLGSLPVRRLPCGHLRRSCGCRLPWRFEAAVRVCDPCLPGSLALHSRSTTPSRKSRLERYAGSAHWRLCGCRGPGVVARARGVDLQGSPKSTTLSGSVAVSSDPQPQDQLWRQGLASSARRGVMAPQPRLRSGCHRALQAFAPTAPDVGLEVELVAENVAADVRLRQRPSSACSQGCGRAFAACTEMSAAAGQAEEDRGARLRVVER